MKENETMGEAIDRLLSTAEDAGINIYGYSDDSVEAVETEES